jgi:ribosome-associated protein
MPDDLPIDRGRVIPAGALRVKTSRASGPGGQHINRTETKVQLTLDPAAIAWLDPGAKRRLLRLAGQSVDSQGHIQVASQEHRDQLQNLTNAREKLALMVARALVRPKRRVATKPTRASQERRIAGKKKRAQTKSARGPVRDD